MTFHLDNHTTTNAKPEMLLGVQTGNGLAHDKYDIRGIAHARTNRKGNIFMKRQLIKKLIYILDKADMELDIFRFKEFFGKKLSNLPNMTNLNNSISVFCLLTQLNPP